jgi:small subunit ribosomal protein S4
MAQKRRKLVLGEYMVRYLGPKNRVARRFSANIFGKKRNPLVHKQNPPGMHGARKKKKSDFGTQLEEKQKLRAVYGMLTEKALLRYYREALKMEGITPENLLRFLECRLDVVVYKLKLAPTIFAAQQLVAHGHIEVNGKKVDVRSFSVEPGMVVCVREKSRKMKIVNDAVAEVSREVPSYLEFNIQNYGGKLINRPDMSQVSLPLPINVPVVCELLAHSH